MGTTFHGPSPWPHITRAIGTRGARYAAIAYLGQDAPDLLPLRAGDLLVVNASKAAIRAHATSPAALAYYVNKGVRVLSSPTLHAKVIVTGRRAVVGSANASENSAFADDAVIITDDPEVIASVRTFIDRIDEVTEVDEVFLDDAAREWEIGRAVPIPGVTGRIRDPEAEFLSVPVTRMFVKHAVDYEPSPTEQHVLDERRSRRPATVGPAVKYALESLRLDRASAVRRGGVVVFVSVDDGWVYPPAVVVSDPMKIPRSGGAVLYFLRIRIDLTPLRLTEAERALTDLGHPGSRLRIDHFVRSPSLRTDLLALWDL
ncbi:phosphatidylserine/phosphatidylglycerophosphate/cardiolipin synthase family protein [Rhodococcus sp. NPDC057529]|uniref:phosphatidylserine/phosphatidylglycerophosphate/ cardiolipin synthase family protein n=1 Tax=Rhodococcus sp. NPDC057529 TaxID=3346158 RepID=UPI0036717A78